MVNEPDEVTPRVQAGQEPKTSPSDDPPGVTDIPNAPVSGQDPEISPPKNQLTPEDQALTEGQEEPEIPGADRVVVEPIPSEGPADPTDAVSHAAETGDSCLMDDPVDSPESGIAQVPDTSGEAESSSTEPDGGATPEGSSEGEEDEEEGGGPVKSFLEHLEDLRWTIIRCLAALLIAMVVCLVAGSKVVELLKEPLRSAQRLVKRKGKPFALIQFGTNKWVLDLESNVFGPFQLGATNGLKLVISPIRVGGETVLGLTPAPLEQKEIPPIYQIDLKNLGPVSPFVVALKIALFGGLGLASPFILLFIGQFVVPALKRKEKKYLYRALAVGTVLFCSGVLFCYFFMLQIALNAAVQFSKWMGFGADIWRAEDYIGFVVKFLLGMGLSFELPVVLLTLVKLELLDYERMNKFRPLWVVMNLVLAAMLTPPDVVSQLLMAIPLQLLFELSVLIAWYWHRRDQKRLALAASSHGD